MMKLARLLLAVFGLTFVAACNAANPTSPELSPTDQPLYEEGTHNGSGG